VDSRGRHLPRQQLTARRGMFGRPLNGPPSGPPDKSAEAVAFFFDDGAAGSLSAGGFAVLGFLAPAVPCLPFGPFWPPESAMRLCMLKTGAEL